MLSCFPPRPVRSFALVLCLAAFAAWFTHGALARQTPQELKRHGDQMWTEKSYKLARQDYEKAITADPNLPDKAESSYALRLPISRSRIGTGRNTPSTPTLRSTPTPLTKHGRRCGADACTTAFPTTAISSGRSCIGATMCRNPRGMLAVQVNKQGDDSRDMLAAWMRAKSLFEQFRRAHRADDDALAAEISLNFDLANLATPGYYRPTPGELESIDWRIIPAEPYAHHWPEPKRVVYLFRQVAYLDALRTNSTHHDVVLAAFGEASYILRMRQYGLVDLSRAVS